MTAVTATPKDSVIFDQQVKSCYVEQKVDKTRSNQLIRQLNISFIAFSAGLSGSALGGLSFLPPITFIAVPIKIGVLAASGVVAVAGLIAMLIVLVKVFKHFNTHHVLFSMNRELKKTQAETYKHLEIPGYKPTQFKERLALCAQQAALNLSYQDAEIVADGILVLGKPESIGLLPKAYKLHQSEIAFIGTNPVITHRYVDTLDRAHIVEVEPSIFPRGRLPCTLDLSKGLGVEHALISSVCFKLNNSNQFKGISSTSDLTEERREELFKSIEEQASTPKVTDALSNLEVKRSEMRNLKRKALLAATMTS